MSNLTLPVIETSSIKGYGSIEAQNLIEDNSKLATNWETFLSICCILMGTGVLQLPAALKEGGWAGFFYIFLTGLMSNYAGMLTVRCLYTKEGERLSTFSDMGFYLYGNLGKQTIQVFKVLSMLGAGSIFILLASINLDQLFSDIFGWKPHFLFWIIVSSIIALIPMILFKEIHESPLITFFGTFTTIFVIVIASSISILVWMKPDFEYPPSSAFKLSGLPISFSSICFAFGGNLLYPDIEKGMKTPQSFDKVLTYSSFVVTIFYAIMAFAGYLAFGDNVLSPVLLSFNPNFFVNAAYLLITAHVLLTAPLLFISISGDMEKDMSSETEMKPFYRHILRATLLFLSVGAALAFPDFEKLIALISSVTISLLSYAIPVFFYMKMYDGRISFGFSDSLLQYSTIFVGLFCFFVGTYLSSIDLLFGK
ncbi:hypothetical protein BB559_006101 [Furculomyces boomerangus]|uniref:Amino acid transporter transmembrane domain-containing protein n=1 Tax=Furculomyces boomerangus TaxID=61424 RepID=A0A2T9Y4P6_9FUNG|nr:hypothetical protein BB559_006101 [Furculomyces boomerangus]